MEPYRYFFLPVLGKSVSGPYPIWYYEYHEVYNLQAQFATCPSFVEIGLLVVISITLLWAELAVQRYRFLAF